jgi:hypothetical protein
MSFVRVRVDEAESREPTPQEREAFIEQMECILLWMLAKFGPQHLPVIDELYAQAHGQVLSVKPALDGTAILSRLEDPKAVV